MSLYYDTSQWCRYLWENHVKNSPEAQRLLAAGTHHNHHFPALADDIHAALYLRNTPMRQAPVPPWCEALFDQLQALPEWQDLRTRCQGQGLPAGLATEDLLDILKQLLPEEHEPDKSQQRKRGQGQAGQQGPPGAPGTAPGLKSSGTADQAAERRALRQAIRAATQDIDGVQAALEGLTGPFGFSTGGDPGHVETMPELDQVRQLAMALRKNPQLQQIAALAGRLHRLGLAHKKLRVARAVGGVRGITQGGDLSRLLPQALTGLRSPDRFRRLQTLQTILERRALQYDIRGTDSLERGPVVVCVDESSSMAEADRYIWAKAVCVALLQTASEQRRAWHYIGFTTKVTHEQTVMPGEANLALLLQLLNRRPGGATDFDPPLTRAMQVIETAPNMRRADIVFITDGESSVSEPLATAILAARQAHDIQLYVIGIGARCENLKPLASAVYALWGNPTDQSNQIAPVIALLDD